MNWQRAFLPCAFFLACYCVEAHDEGPPPTGITLVSLGLTLGGAVLVSLTLLALLWKPIDSAFRVSRFRARWEQRSTRVAFALAFMAMAGAIAGGITYLVIEKDEQAEHAEHEGGAAQTQPQHGGQVAKEGRFVLEVVARRTGEFRLYISVLEGAMPSSLDVKPQISILPETPTSPTNLPVPMKITVDGAYFLAVTDPPQQRLVRAHLSVKISQEHFDADFNLPVQD